MLYFICKTNIFKKYIFYSNIYLSKLYYRFDDFDTIEIERQYWCNNLHMRILIFTPINFNVNKFYNRFV